MNENHQKQTINSDNIIPAFPSVIIEINRIIDLPETNYKNLSKIIEKDPAICARILKIVNSAFYGMPSEISNIPDAVSVLGFDIVHRIALTISVLNTIKNNDTNFNDIALWKHLFFTANINRFISMEYKISKPGDAYIGGLLHDIGKFILYRMSSDYYEKIKSLCIEKKIRFHMAEEKLKGFPSHCELGAFAAEEWKFPKTLADSIKYHHKYTEKAISQEDHILLLISNYIENHKDIILHKGINIKGINPKIKEVIGKPLEEINSWLPGVMEKSKKEFQTFTESLK